MDVYGLPHVAMFFSRIRSFFVTYKSGYGGLHICIFTLCLILMAEFPLVLFCILHLFLSVCHVFPPPTFVLAVSRRQCSRQPKELEKIRFETLKSLFSTDGDCLLQFLPPIPLLTGLSFSMNGGEWLDRTNVDCAYAV